MPVTKVEMELGGRTLSIETGRIAKQADGAVMVQYGETVVLGTVVHADPRPGLDFFPLTVDYREKISAAGKFPGGFRKREGAPNTKEILTMRNIDRPVRPLFPKGYIDEVQIQCWVMAYDGVNEPDVIAGIAASAALSISSVPFQGPLGNVRIGRIDGKLCVMPTTAQADYSDLDLLLCGHADGLNMIEVGAEQIPESEMLEAIEFGFRAGQGRRHAHRRSAEQGGKPKQEFDATPVAGRARPDGAAPRPADRGQDQRGHQARSPGGGFAVHQGLPRRALPRARRRRRRGHVEQVPRSLKIVKTAVHDLEEEVTREIIRTGKRTDGRAMDELRPIECATGVLPRVHGSALFQRGETQALVTIVLGTGKDEQIVDGLDSEYGEKFYLHYNFPPFSVGEAKRITGPGRREIGHGKLAERALAPVLPDVDKFPYTVRVVSDITESNGSSSMASACGGCLALMDAGVPLKATVAGISIGMITGDDATTTSTSPTSRARKTTSATWTSRSPAPARASPPSSSTSRPVASTWIRSRRPSSSPGRTASRSSR